MQGLIKACNFKKAVVSGEKEMKKGLYRSWVVYVKLRTNGRNNSQQCCVRLHGAKSLTGFNFAQQQLPETRNNMQQGVRTDATYNTNNVGSCWPIKLRPFAQSFTLSKNK